MRASRCTAQVILVQGSRVWEGAQSVPQGLSGGWSWPPVPLLPHGLPDSVLARREATDPRGVVVQRESENSQAEWAYAPRFRIRARVGFLLLQRVESVFSAVPRTRYSKGKDSRR